LAFAQSPSIINEDAKARKKSEYKKYTNFFRQNNEKIYKVLTNEARETM
jgi:hypothetical protein